MDNVLFGLGFLSLAGVIAFLVIAVVRIFKKKPRKNFVVAALICFVASNVFIFCGAQTNYNEFEINMDRHYSLVFHGIIGIVIAATAMIIPFGSFASGIKSCAADIICLAVGIAAALLLDRFNRKFDKD